MLHTWIACLAVLFSALAPSISHALAASGGGAVRVEICSADGVQYVFLSDSGKKSPDPGSAMGMNHCAYCATHAGSFALLPPSLAGLRAIGGHDSYPVLFYHAPQLLFNWTVAHPRGPPARP